jgi:hypothetical protein
VARQQSHDFLAPGGDGQAFREIDVQWRWRLRMVHGMIIP